MAKSRKTKPSKPYKDFPLTANGNGQWSKKIRGKVFYFGPWGDPDGALQKYLHERDDLQAGRDPRRGRAEGLTLEDLCNLYLHSQRRRADEGEISERSFQERRADSVKLLDILGRTRSVDSLQPADFSRVRHELAKRLALVTMRNTLVRIRSMFKWAHKSKHITTPMEFGPDFDLPSKHALRRKKLDSRRKNGPLIFEREELLSLIETAQQPMMAMILMGANCGFGQTDCACLPLSALDLKNGWVDFPRPKTSVDRRIPLWPETVQAIEDALTIRPNSKDAADGDLVFLTRNGRRWVRTNKNGTPDDELGKEFAKLMNKLGLKRPGRSFYALRRGLETIGGETGDQVAVNSIMGHADQTMAFHYRERIDDSRLRAVTEHVRGWLYSNEAEEAESKANEANPKAKPALRIVG